MKFLPKGVFGERFTAESGGICSRLFDCMISDVEVSNAVICGDHANGLVARIYGLENSSISSIVVGDVSLRASSYVDITTEGNNIYVGSELNEFIPG